MSEVRNDLLDPRLSIGGNRGPALDAVTIDLIDEELAEDRREADILIQRATTSLIKNTDDAAGVHLLGAKLKTLSKKLDEARKSRCEPYREAVAIINACHHTQLDRIDATVADLERMLGDFRKKQDEEARTAREAAEAEARRHEEEAAAAAAKLAEAKTITFADQVEAQKLQEAAELAQRRAETIRPAPIATAVGSIAATRQKAHEITDWNLAMRWLAKFHRDALRAAAAEIIRKHLNTIPIARYLSTQIPGVRLFLEESARIRSR